MPEFDRELCRKAAAECVELARATTDHDRKQVLLVRAQEWLKLAYSRNDAEFEILLAGFNREQLGHQPPIRRGPMQQQEVQQQQSKVKSDDEA